MYAYLYRPDITAGVTGSTPAGPDCAATCLKSRLSDENKVKQLFLLQGL